MHKIIAELRARGVPDEMVEEIERALRLTERRRVAERSKKQKQRARPRDMSPGQNLSPGQPRELPQAVEIAQPCPGDAPPLRSLEIERRKSDIPIPLPTDLEKQLFVRGREVLGSKAGGLINQLHKALGVELARARIETAATKGNPREYVGAVLAAIRKDADRPKTWVDHIQ